MRTVRQFEARHWLLFVLLVSACSSDKVSGDCTTCIEKYGTLPSKYVLKYEDFTCQGSSAITHTFEVREDTSGYFVNATPGGGAPLQWTGAEIAPIVDSVSDAWNALGAEVNIDVSSSPTTAGTAEVYMVDGSAGSKYPDAIAGIGCAGEMADPCRRTTCEVLFFTEKGSGAAIRWTLDADGAAASNPALTVDSFSFPHAAAHEWGHVLGLGDNYASKLGTSTIMEAVVSVPTQYTALPSADQEAVKWMYGVP